MAGYNQQMAYPDMSRNIMQQPSYGVATNNSILNNPYDYMGGRLQSNVQNQFLKCRPVSSREEAVGSQIDLDGSLWVFPDLGNDKIYTKQIRNDGTATFRTYAYVDQTNSLDQTSNYVTKDEFNKVIHSIMAAIGTKDNQTGNKQQQPIPASNNINNTAVEPLNF